MTALKDCRKTARLHIDHGVVLLHAPRLTALPCSLHDLSASGCRAQLQLDHFDPAILADWTPLFTLGKRLDIELSRPPFFKALRLPATIAHVGHDALNNPELGLHFLELDSLQIDALRRGLQAIATDKIKHGHLADEVEAVLPSAIQLPMPIEHPEWSHEKLAQKSLGDVLVMLEMLTEIQRKECEDGAAQRRLTLPQYLLKRCLVQPDALCRALALHSGLPMVSLKQKKFDDELGRIFSYLTLLRYNFVPFAYSKEILCAASAEPLAPETITELVRHCNREILNFLAPVDQIRSQLFKQRPRAAFKDRRHSRFEASIPASFIYCDENGINLKDDVQPGEIQSLSEGGFLLETLPMTGFSAHYLMEHRAQVRLSFSWPPDDIHALCLIRYIQSKIRRDTPGHTTWMIGLQIVDLSQRDANLLRDVCTKAGLRPRKG